jgi:creatinine amidohydrolase
MLRITLNLCMAVAALAAVCPAQSLSAKWEELTAEDFVKALQQSRGTCALPFGIIEKHGPTGPMGTDLINVRYTTMKAVQQEYVVVFPEYYVGQIFEAKHQPGTIAYSTHLQLEMRQETVAEMARNGCKKILIVNGHGGNTALIQYFGQTQLATPKDYIVYSFSGLGGGNQADVPAAARASKPGVDGHAGEGEESNVMASRPELVHPDRAGEESGANLQRLDLPQGVFTAIFWYASFPNHYQGDAAGANAARGTASVEFAAQRLANAIRAVKADQNGPRLQKEFFEASGHPVDTKQ